MNRGKRIAALPLAMLVVALALVAAAPAAAAMKGTVVHRVQRSHSFVVATESGTLAAIHARRSPRVGRVVRVATRRLSNGRLHGRSVRVVGRRNRVRLRGTVTYASRKRKVFVVSAPGTSMLVHGDPSGQGATATVPAVGRVVVTDAVIDPTGKLVADDVDDVGEDRDGIELEGTILAIDATTRTLTVSADDCHKSRAAVPVVVPTTFDLAQFQVGRDVELVVTRQADRTFVLVRGLQELAGGTPDPLDRSPAPLPVTALPTLPPAPVGTTPATGGLPPGSGSQAPATGTQAAAPTATPSTVDLEGTVLAIDGQARTVTLSNRSTPGAAPSTFTVPQPFDMSRFWAGQALHVVATRQPNGTLEFQRIVPPPPVQVLRFKGTIVAVEGQARTVTLRSCDSTSCSGPVKVLVPPSFDVSKYRVGQRVELQVTQQSDGAYVLQKASWPSGDDDDDDDHDDDDD